MIATVGYLQTCNCGLDTKVVVIIHLCIYQLGYGMGINKNYKLLPEAVY